MVMRMLLDTHTFLWWVFDDPQLSAVARAAIADADNDVFLSAASAWEIATKARIGKLPEAGDVPARLPHYLRRAGFQSLPISLEHGLFAGAMRGDHRDPFDRMLAAQGRIEDLEVVTADPAIGRLGARTLW